MSNLRELRSILRDDFGFELKSVGYVMCDNKALDEVWGDPEFGDFEFEFFLYEAGGWASGDHNFGEVGALSGTSPDTLRAAVRRVAGYYAALVAGHVPG